MNHPENQFDNLVTAINDLKNRGFQTSFKLEKEGLTSLTSGQAFQPRNLVITEYHRFEGATDFEDMSILYAIATDSGEQGIVIDAYGTYANRNLAEFLKNVKIEGEG